MTAAFDMFPSFVAGVMSVGVPGGPSEVAARIILESYGLTPNDVHFLSHDDLTMSELAQRIRDKATDVGVVSTSFPVPTMTESIKELGIELVPLEPDKITWIRSRYPFYEPIRHTRRHISGAAVGDRDNRGSWPASVPGRLARGNRCTG